MRGGRGEVCECVSPMDWQVLPVLRTHFEKQSIKALLKLYWSVHIPVISSYLRAPWKQRQGHHCHRYQYWNACTVRCIKDLTIRTLPLIPKTILQDLYSCSRCTMKSSLSYISDLALATHSARWQSECNSGSICLQICYLSTVPTASSCWFLCTEPRRAPGDREDTQ